MGAQSKGKERKREMSKPVHKSIEREYLSPLRQQPA
jgi:hypothetical protein